VAGRFAFLEWKSPFRCSLSKISLDDFVATLNELFSPLPLNQLTVPLLLGLGELASRPELVLPLLPLVEDMPLDPDSRIRVVELAEAAGAHAVVRRMLGNWAAKHIRAMHRAGFTVVSSVDLLARYDPSMALRVLKQTRDPGVRRFEDETKSERLRVAAEAMIRLNRKTRAQRLQELAVARR
jgi:hypothetical protein